MDKLWNSNYVKVWIANFMLNFSFMILTPLLPLYLSEHFDASKDVIGIVLFGYSLTALLIRPFSGYFVDSFPRKTVLLTAYFAFAILFGGYIVAGSLLFFFIVRTLHGAPMGAATVANSTVAIDVLPSSRRAEGIGYYGISNNTSTAIAPAIGLYIYHLTDNAQYIFFLALATAFIGFFINSTLSLAKREQVQHHQPVSLDRFFLTKAWPEVITMACFAFAFAVVSTYLAIYGKDELGITTGSGLFFVLMSTGLVLSRLIGARSLRDGKIVENGTHGILIALAGYLLFAALHNKIGYFGAALIIGFGNGHMFPAMQTIFINLAPHSRRGTANSTFLISWDTGMGIGIMTGGVIAEHFGYAAAFWVAAAMVVAGALHFLLSNRKHYLQNRLR
ncbi:MAG: MFS transporter [Prevotella sp.]|nr:MFS transporter [Prevotella sp.]